MEAKDQIKSRLPIADIVGSYIKLERAGSNFKACCPFHKEKSPSFNVSPARDAFYCFGCQKGGDIFTFVQEMEGMTFPEALKVLADKAGVTLPERHQRLPQEQDRRERLFAVMEEASKYYEAMLAKNPEPRAYLHKRGLTDETIAKFRIGFVPDGWRNLRDHLLAKKFTDQDLLDARLTKPTEGKAPYDTFRSRIMFPINDASGRTIAFTGRVWGQETTADGSAIAKYLNSPEGELYDKSRVLFAYDRARMAMRKADRVVLVEGQMDCIMAHQAGAENTVAISGTALTEPQLGLIKRLTENITLSLDSDNAGINATLRSAKLAMHAGLKVAAIRVPDGKDPADYILGHKDNENAWSEVLKSAEPIVPYLMHVYAILGVTGDALRERIGKEVLPLIAGIPSRIEQAQLVTAVARALGVPESAVFADVDKLAKNLSIESVNMPLPQTATAAPVAPVKSSSVRSRAEEELLAIIAYGADTSDSKIPHEELRNRYESLMREFDLPVRNIDEADRVRMLVKVECAYAPNINLGQVAEELLSTIERDIVKERQSMVLAAITHAERLRESTHSHLENYRALSIRLRTLEDKPTIS